MAPGGGSGWWANADAWYRHRHFIASEAERGAIRGGGGGGARRSRMWALHVGNEEIVARLLAPRGASHLARPGDIGSGRARPTASIDGMCVND